MRILASNPDTIGDMVLRQPMYHALAAAGHELMLIVRPSVRPLLAHVAPAAQVLELPFEVYSTDLPEHWQTFATLFDSARRFQPEVLLVAPFRWTLFEEKLAQELSGVRRAGMNGRLYAGDPYAGRAPDSTMRFDLTAQVEEDAPEIEKNAALAALLGCRPQKIDPELRANEPQLARAKQIVAELGLLPGFWTACVTGTAHVPIKAWPAENWAQLLAQWSAQHDRRFLFVGLHEEEPVAREVQQLMGRPAKQTAVWMPPGGTLDELMGLIALCAGYVGHDTGPMHLAAALGKPALAVFAGGHRLRFLPAVDPSISLTVGVSCAGCEWLCSFDRSHCVKALPVQDVWIAAQDLEAGKIIRREARVLEPEPRLAAQMLKEANAFAQRQLRESADLARRLNTLTQSAAPGLDLNAALESQAKDLANLRAELDASQRELDRLSRELSTRTQETTRVRDELDEVRHTAQDLAGALRQREAQVEHLQAELSSKSQGAQAIAAEFDRQTLEISRLREEISEMIRQVGRDYSSAGGLPADAVSPLLAGVRVAELRPGNQQEVDKLREQVQRLEERMGVLEPRRTRPPLKYRLVEWIVGKQHYLPPFRAPLPKLTVVTPVLNAEPSVRRTVESVLAQNHPHLEYIVVDGGSTDRTLEILNEYSDRIDRILSEPDAGPFDAIGKGFHIASGEVLAYINAGDVYEPGGLLRVGEYFRDHPSAEAIYYEDSIQLDGWRFPAPPRPWLDVDHLLRCEERFPNGVFFTRRSYRALGGINRRLRHVADWDLWIRIARRFGLERLPGQIRTIRQRTSSDAYRSELAHARQQFSRRFGTVGRMRCRLLHWGNRLTDWLRPLLERQPLFFPLNAANAKLPPGQEPQLVPAQPVCPLTKRLPDRLLFSTRDTNSADAQIHHVYYDSAAGAALAYPPLGPERLKSLYNGRTQDSHPRVVPPPTDAASPYAHFRGGLFSGQALAGLPSPYWWFRKPRFSDPTADDVLASLKGLPLERTSPLRFLAVGCFDGALLDTIRQRKGWQTFGAETNAAAAQSARKKGHPVWETSAQDLPMVVPDGILFDVILLRHAERLQDPLLVVRRLKQMLEPGGLLVLAQPNLDSRHVEIFGPTWAHWQIPYHRILMGRRAMRALARLADMKVIRLRTRTHPYPVCVSAQLNALGLGAIVPDSARFPNEIASRGVRLTGWSRLLWDWRGRGDYLYAVLQN